MDDMEELLLVILLYCYLKRRASTRIERIRDNSSVLIGHAYTQELLRGSNAQCYELMHLSRDAYVLLCNHFKQKNWLQNSRYISVEEKMAMFLTIIGHDERFAIVKRRFQHSPQTIHKCFREVLGAMMKFAREIFEPTSFVETPNMPERYRNLKEIFPGAIGALDAILVHAVVPDDQQAKYIAREKDDCSQHVLAICDFNMLFTFVWAGWEGGAEDSIVLTEVAFNPNSGFPFPPPNKYYMCDAAYADIGHTKKPGFLTPYRKTRYSLADFRRQPPLTKEERFNHVHAQLRNVIERAYCVLKTRFSILKQMAPYPFTVQRNTVIACFAIHNFIRNSNIQDKLFMKYDDDNVMFTVEEHHEESDEEVSDEEDDEMRPKEVECMVNLRDQIANQLWLIASN